MSYTEINSRASKQSLSLPENKYSDDIKTAIEKRKKSSISNNNIKGLVMNSVEKSEKILSPKSRPTYLPPLKNAHIVGTVGPEASLSPKEAGSAKSGGGAGGSYAGAARPGGNGSFGTLATYSVSDNSCTTHPINFGTGGNGTWHQKSD